MMMPPQVMQQQMSSKQQVSATKVTKVRRARQPRNPQLSVARRNERERNRVKMVNNGFALLREHLPVEDLRHCEERPDAASPGAATPDGGKSASAKAKKYSKVETLRAAIQRIKMLEELIRSSDAEFESMNIIPASASSSSPHIALANACNYDDEPLSVCAPLSCDSSNSTTTTTTATMHLDITSMHSTHHLQHPNQISYAGSQQQQQQFIKLEPQQQQQHHYSPQRAASHLPSPTQNSQASSSASVTQYHQPPTQVQHNSLEQQPQSLHTHLWLQQHQSSFIEQQQQQHQYTAPEHIQLSQQQHGTGSSWQYMHEQKAQVESGNWYVQDASPAATGEQQQQQQFQQQPQAESKVWFSSAGDSSPGIATTASPSASSQPFAGSHHHHHHHQHQISLYSQ